jgi:hypothetical protein
MTMSKNAHSHRNGLIHRLKQQIGAVVLVVSLAPAAFATDNSNALAKPSPEVSAEIHFGHHNFSVYCFETTACKVTYDGEKEALYEEGEYAPARRSRKGGTGLSASHLNFAADRSHKGPGRFDEVEVYSHDFVDRDESAEDLLKLIATKRTRQMAAQAKKPRQTDNDRIRADYESALAQLKALGAPNPYNEKNKHEHLFVAMFDAPRIEPSEKKRPSSQMSELRMTLDRIADSYPRIRGGYINAPTIHEVNPPSSAGYLKASNIITRRMYERLSTQMWEWKQSDPDAHAVLVTPMEGAGTLQAVDFLDIVRNFQVVNRTSIRDTDESTEGAEVD